MRASVSFVVLSLAAVACGWSKPAASPENSDESDPSSESGSSNKPAETDGTSASLDTGSATQHTPPPAEKATIKDDAEHKESPCSGDAIPDLLATISQAACELPENAPAAKQRPSKDLLEVKASIDGKVAPGSIGRVVLVYTNKGKAPLPIDFTIDPDPRITFELYTPKGGRVDKPAGNEPPLPASVADAPTPDSHIARVTIAPRGKATLSLPWTAVRYRWSSKEKAKGALPGRGYPREPAGPLARGKYVLKIVTPLVNTDEGGDHELSEARVNVEVAGNPQAAPPPPEPAAPVARKKEAPPPAAPASEPPTEAQIEQKFLKVTGGSSAAPAAPAKKK